MMKTLRILCLDDNFEAKTVLSNFFEGTSSLNGLFLEDLDSPPLCTSVKDIARAINIIKEEKTFDVWTLDYTLSPWDGNGVDFLKRVFQECPDKIPNDVNFHSGNYTARKMMEDVFNELRVGSCSGSQP